MRNLIQFLIKYNYWLLLAIYLLVGIVMLFNYNVYHRSVYIGSSNKITGEVFSVSGNIKSYFNLQETNAELLAKNGYLEARTLQLEEQFKAISAGRVVLDSTQTSFFNKYSFVSAKVINNSISNLQNYITLNKGRLDGLETDMGVIDQNGVVGIVSSVSDHFAVVISVLNPKLRLSAKLKRNNFFGSVVWNGKRSIYGVLEELPRHVQYKQGDTLVTSGYSAVFPEGITIGYIDEKQKVKKDETTPIKVRFSTQFGSLNYVLVITNKLQKEQRTLESEVQ